MIDKKLIFFRITIYPHKLISDMSVVSNSFVFFRKSVEKLVLTQNIVSR